LENSNIPRTDSLFRSHTAPHEYLEQGSGENRINARNRCENLNLMSVDVMYPHRQSDVTYEQPTQLEVLKYFMTYIRPVNLCREDAVGIRLFFFPPINDTSRSIKFVVSADLNEFLEICEGVVLPKYECDEFRALAEKIKKEGFWIPVNQPEPPDEEG
jgi:hypothetical protein